MKAIIRVADVKLLTLKPSFLSKILSLADMGEGRVWIRRGRVKIDYLVHFGILEYESIFSMMVAGGSILTLWIDTI